jgi:hypothetical protein
MAASVLRAETFGIPVPDWIRNPKMVAEAVDKVIVPDFQPREGVKIETDEKATNLSNASVDDAAIINELIRKLELCRENLPAGFRMKPIQFEKVLFLQLSFSNIFITHFFGPPNRGIGSRLIMYTCSVIIAEDLEACI